MKQQPAWEGVSGVSFFTEMCLNILQIQRGLLHLGPARMDQVNNDGLCQRQEPNQVAARACRAWVGLPALALTVTTSGSWRSCLVCHQFFLPVTKSVLSMYGREINGKLRVGGRSFLSCKHAAADPSPPHLREHKESRGWEKRRIGTKPYSSLSLPQFPLKWLLEFGVWPLLKHRGRAHTGLYDPLMIEKSKVCLCHTKLLNYKLIQWLRVFYFWFSWVKGGSLLFIYSYKSQLLLHLLCLILKSSFIFTWLCSSRS